MKEEKRCYLHKMVFVLAGNLAIIREVPFGVGNVVDVGQIVTDRRLRQLFFFLSLSSKNWLFNLSKSSF
jgi:hypothetical protein